MAPIPPQRRRGEREPHDPGEPQPDHAEQHPGADRACGRLAREPCASPRVDGERDEEGRPPRAPSRRRGTARTAPRGRRASAPNTASTFDRRRRQVVRHRPSRRGARRRRPSRRPAARRRGAPGPDGRHPSSSVGRVSSLGDASGYREVRRRSVPDRLRLVRSAAAPRSRSPAGIRPCERRAPAEHADDESEEGVDGGEEESGEGESEPRQHAEPALAGGAARS